MAVRAAPAARGRGRSDPGGEVRSGRSPISTDTTLNSVSTAEPRAAVPDGLDPGRPDPSLSDAEPDRQLEVVARGAHRAGHEAAIDVDLQRLLDDERLGDTREVRSPSNRRAMTFRARPRAALTIATVGAYRRVESRPLGDSRPTPRRVGARPAGGSGGPIRPPPSAAHTEGCHPGARCGARGCRPVWPRVSPPPRPTGSRPRG